jgi:hypothetical protein
MYARTVSRTEFRVAWALLAGVEYENGLYARCGCGRRVLLCQVEGRVSDTVLCDERCTSARGHKCECSCGGLNHGADHE